MRQIAILFIVCMQFLSCQKVIHEIDFSFEENVSVTDYKDGFQKIYQGKQKIAEGHINGGKKNGFWKFYKNGNLIAEGNFSNGIKNGFWKAYHDTGRVKSEGHLTNDIPQGFWKFYTKEGKASERRY